MAPSPLVEAPAPAASEPASLNTLWGGHGRLTYPPSDGSRPSLTKHALGDAGASKYGSVRRRSRRALLAACARCAYRAASVSSAALPQEIRLPLGVLHAFS
jgi:hypothetical protein